MRCNAILHYESPCAGIILATCTNKVARDCPRTCRRLNAGARVGFSRLCGECCCVVLLRVLEVCTFLTRCIRHIRGANAGMVESKAALNEIYASGIDCDSDGQNDADDAKKSNRSAPAVVSVAEHDCPQAEGLHSSIRRAMAIALNFSHRKTMPQGSCATAPIIEGCRVRVKVTRCIMSKAQMQCGISSSLYFIINTIIVTTIIIIIIVNSNIVIVRFLLLVLLMVFYCYSSRQPARKSLISSHRTSRPAPS